MPAGLAPKALMPVPRRLRRRVRKLCQHEHVSLCLNVMTSSEVITSAMERFPQDKQARKRPKDDGWMSVGRLSRGQLHRNNGL